MIGHYNPLVKKVCGRDFLGGGHGRERTAKKEKRMQPQKRDIYENRRFTTKENLVFSLRRFSDVLEEYPVPDSKRLRKIHTLFYITREGTTTPKNPTKTPKENLSTNSKVPVITLVSC